MMNMTNRFYKITIFTNILLISLFFMNCSSQEDFSGFSYDPEGATITVDKEIQKQHKRTIGVADAGIWISNEFAGARMNDFYQVNDSLFRVVIEPENHPINDSPWYAFKVWSFTERSINLELTYEHGEHRYVPELSSDGKEWQTMTRRNYEPDTLNGTAMLKLDVKQEPLLVTAQELVTEDDYRKWSDSLAKHPFVWVDTVGFSHEHRPVLKMKISETAIQNPGVLIITGRQHPPEVTGALACRHFINELVSDSELATEFRQNFEVWAYPFANPDGVQNGHWRHNGAGVDLNRDWKAFNQPETRAIRNDLLMLKDDTLRTVYYGIDFHSTDENIFYPINRDISTFPEDFTYRWLEQFQQTFPDYPVEVEPFDTSSPIAKNWIYHTFGADAVTYEVNDTANRDSLRKVTKESARILMQQLLDEKKENEDSGLSN
jgi:hypothetical protein